MQVEGERREGGWDVRRYGRRPKWGGREESEMKGVKESGRDGKKEEVKERREKGNKKLSEGRRKTNGIWDRRILLTL